jgi:hypothetical protein
VEPRNFGACLNSQETRVEAAIGVVRRAGAVVSPLDYRTLDWEVEAAGAHRGRILVVCIGRG